MTRESLDFTFTALWDIMSTTMEQHPLLDLNPVLNVTKDGIVLYSNKASEPLLQEWSVRTGETLPSSIVDLVQRVIFRNTPEKMEVKTGNRVFLVVFSPLPEQECVNISGFDISDSNVLEERFYENKTREINLELAEIVDVQAIQSLMDDFYKFAHITIAIVDLKGNILVSVGWQDICTKFHRVHPMTCKFCVESDTKLSAGVPIGEFKLYKCKNNMWDIATPIIVGNIHLGNIFSGQFFFEDEPLDYGLFRSQARRYGFNEKEYLTALEKVPRMSREDVETSMSFFMKLANMISQLSISNIKLAQSLADCDTLVRELRVSEERLHHMSHAGHIGLYEWNTDRDIIYFSPEAYELYGCDPNSLVTYENWFMRIHPADRKMVEYSIAKAHDNARYMHDNSSRYEFRVVHADGTVLWLEAESTYYLEDGDLIARGAIRDITENKLAEEAFKESEAKANALIKYAPTGIYELDYRGPRILSVNDAMCTLSGYSREELLSMNPTDILVDESKNLFTERIISQLAGEKINDEVEFNVRKRDGSLINVVLNIAFSKDKPYTALVIGHDVTERKKAEDAIKEAYDSLEVKVKERTAELEKTYQYLKRIEVIRKQEIHHRIKNNLQVISSLLDLQAEKFRGKKNIENSQILEAFKESQDRVISMALIHEELHKGGEVDTLNFSNYVHELTDNLFLSYRIGNNGINLGIDLEEDTYFDMDTAIPLGIIINELVSNSLKHAFPDREEGEIQIKFYTEEVRENKTERSKSKTFTLSISDNGIGIPEDIDIENLDSLGLQLLTTLVEQLDGELEMRRDNGTKFIIKFTVTEKLKEEDVPAIDESATTDKTTQLTLHKFCLPE